jgi:1,4-dihydroxy-6-naphthoate synthase
MDESVMYQHIALYVNEYSIDLGVEGKKAIDKLFEKARALQFIPESKNELYV